MCDGWRCSGVGASATEGRPIACFLQAGVSEPVIASVPTFYSPLLPCLQLPSARPLLLPTLTLCAEPKNDLISGRRLGRDGAATMERFHNPYGEPGVARDEEERGWPPPRLLRGKSMSDDPLLFEKAPFLAPDGSGTVSSCSRTRM